MGLASRSGLELADSAHRFPDVGVAGPDIVVQLVHVKAPTHNHSNSLAGSTSGNFLRPMCIGVAGSISHNRLWTAESRGPA